MGVRMNINMELRGPILLKAHLGMLKAQSPKV